MRAGKLRHRIEIQAKSSAQTAYGDFVDDWTTEFEVWASFDPLRGDETANVPVEQAKVTYQFGTRYHAGILPNKRVKFGTRLFDIKSVLNVEERNRELNLLCVEVIPDGV